MVRTRPAPLGFLSCVSSLQAQDLDAPATKKLSNAQLQPAPHILQPFGGLAQPACVLDKRPLHALLPLPRLCSKPVQTAFRAGLKLPTLAGSRAGDG